MSEKKNIGRIVRVIGPVVDVEFDEDCMPAIYNALKVDAETPVGKVSTVLEVEGHRPGGIVRTDRKSTRLNSSHSGESRMPSSA